MLSAVGSQVLTEWDECTFRFKSIKRTKKTAPNVENIGAFLVK
jgi:hypothetical protein